MLTAISWKSQILLKHMSMSPESGPRLKVQFSRNNILRSIINATSQVLGIDLICKSYSKQNYSSTSSEIIHRLRRHLLQILYLKLRLCGTLHQKGKLHKKFMALGLDLLEKYVISKSISSSILPQSIATQQVRYFSQLILQYLKNEIYYHTLLIMTRNLNN